MNLIDRFTRDRVSRVVWGLCVIAALGLLSLAVVSGRRAADDERAAAQARAVSYATTVIEPVIAVWTLDEPFANGQLQELTSIVETQVLADPRVEALRVWARDGRLLFSTEPGDALGSDEALNDPQLHQAVGRGVFTIDQRSLAEDPDGGTELITYVGVATDADAHRAGAVGPPRDATVGAAGGEWFLLQLFAGGLVLVFLILTVLSFRDPVAKIGAGVGFVAEAVPPGFAVIEEERLRAVNDVYELARERVARLKERLRVSEEARMAAEGELQRILSRFETPRRTAARGLPATAPVAVRQVPMVEDATVVESEVVEAEVVAPESEPEAVWQPEPEHEVVWRREPEVVEQPEPEPEPAPEPEPEPEPETEPISVESRQPVTAASADRFSYPHVPGVVDLQEEDEDDAALARELLLRLMETEIPMADTGVDPGEVRAKLARTAARKKPGGGERRIVEEEPVRESRPWARNR